jgi:hypothetical protein
LYVSEESRLAGSKVIMVMARFDAGYFRKVEEKREIISLTKLRKPGEREREKCSAIFFEVSHTKRKKTFL